MTKLYRLTFIPLALAAFALCQACANGQVYRVPIQLISNTDVEVVRATAHRKPDGIVVGGDVRRPNGYAGVVPGHLRVIGRDGSGREITAADAPWGEFINRRFRRAYFSAFLRTDNPAAITAISVEPITRPQP